MSIQMKDQQNKNIKVEFLQFAGGERHVQIDPSIFTETNKKVFITAQILNSQDLMDYLLLENALFAQGFEVSLEIPYLPYARQDRICATGQAFSLEVMVRLLNLNSTRLPQQRKQLIVWDAHSSVTLQLMQQELSFQTIRHIQADEIISQSIELKNILENNNSVLICPDKGAKQRMLQLANVLNLKREQPIEVIYCEKIRNPQTGKITHTQVHASDLSHKTAIICDDICDGGATFIGIAQALRQLGCQQIILYITHGIFSKGLQVFDGLVDQIFTTNSFPQQSNDKLHVIEFQS